MVEAFHETASGTNTVLGAGAFQLEIDGEGGYVIIKVCLLSREKLRTCALQLNASHECSLAVPM
jgi:hypothetical protein